MSGYTEAVNCFPERIRKSSTNYEVLDYRFDNYRTCFATLYKIAGCVYFPDILKPYIWMDDDEVKNTAKWDASIDLYKDSNGLFKKDLMNKKIRVKKGSKQFKFIHLRGTHEPYYIDESGDETDQHWDWQIATKGARGEVKINSNEAGLINFAATIADLSEAEDTSRYGLSILDIDENTEFDRYFYSFVCNSDGKKNTSSLVEYITR